VLIAARVYGGGGSNSSSSNSSGVTGVLLYCDIIVQNDDSSECIDTHRAGDAHVQAIITILLPLHDFAARETVRINSLG